MRPFRYFSTVLIATMIVVGCPGAHVFQGDEQTRPLTGHGGKWRIAYYEGGAYVDYKDCMRAIIKGLMTPAWTMSPPGWTRIDTCDRFACSTA